MSTGSVGPDFAEGGIEYYQKLLARNRALRELLGDEGRRRFTPEGNYKTSIANWIEDLTIPAVHRTLTVDKLDSFFVSFSSTLFLDAFSHLYKRVCPSVGRSVHPSVRHTRVGFPIFRLK